MCDMRWSEHLFAEFLHKNFTIFLIKSFELASHIWLIEPLMEKLKEKGLMTEHLENKINEQLEVNSVEDTIDDIIVSWHERMERMRTCCFKIRKITKLISTQLTMLEKIKLD